ncbi:MAG: hypothetical protein U5J63_16715 [Fodinibius sp.]|nr:hypothetical protein [Fodinibius sp.]
MVDYKITYKDGHSTRWVQFLLIMLGILQLISFIVALITDEVNWFNFLELLAGFAAISVGLYRYEEYFFPYPELTLTDHGIEVSHQGREHQFSWDLIHGISIDSNTITLELTNGKSKEFDIQYLNYGDIQAAKQEIKQRCEAREISYQSVY